MVDGQTRSLMVKQQQVGRTRGSGPSSFSRRSCTVEPLSHSLCIATLSLTLSLSVTHSLSLSHTHTQSLSLTHTLSHSLSHTRTHTHSLSHSLSLTHSLSQGSRAARDRRWPRSSRNTATSARGTPHHTPCTLSLSRTYNLSLTHTISLSYSLSHTHTLSLSDTHTHTNTGSSKHAPRCSTR